MGDHCRGIQQMFLVDVANLNILFIIIQFSMNTFINFYQDNLMVPVVQMVVVNLNIKFIFEKFIKFKLFSN